MNIRKLDDNFSLTAQILPDQIKAIAKAGYRSIVRARSGHEEFGRPSVDEVARAAQAEGLQIVHIPVSRGSWRRTDHLVSPGLGTDAQACGQRLPLSARAGSLYATLNT